ncbi:hypothetical protein EMIHUDRAFT_468676 [Emiliania huxleyi CCMP1516]|uniref:SPX domain-containing protein n=2 Tax=Emiliania huxleyi TaxID=2903 RepID=A0A0D3JYW8_EMIH1|nr:hypothetical protein EMIHUDRAFT_468676 [Emiliania huxleyi CCMP1516]EOD28703.1 hypothetical protein EMIHUDRAFT_468676 [Emiliania huxleyi CCMP1516]|eukprot:XP_005781132.1 hypothetical protein EMIHUDRAFT_468676 [Emiliania huxleyi CCMP1516]
MKFGQTLRAAQWPPWDEVYIPYKSLKKILKAGAAGEAGFGATEGSFVAKLCDAVSSVDAFFTAQVGLLTRRLAALRTASQVSGAELAAVSEEMDVLCSGVDWLRGYAELNRVAVRKILKKHDKSSQIALTPSLGPWVERRAFASLRGLDALLRAAENFLALLVAPLDGRRSGQAAGPNGAQAACGGAPAAAKVEPPASIVWQPRPRGAEAPRSPSLLVRNVPACVECHRSKTACSGGFPCTRCLRLGKVCVPRQRHKRFRTAACRAGAASVGPSHAAIADEVVEEMRRLEPAAGEPEPGPTALELELEPTAAQSQPSQPSPTPVALQGVVESASHSLPNRAARPGTVQASAAVARPEPFSAVPGVCGPTTWLSGNLELLSAVARMEGEVL